MSATTGVRPLKSTDRVFQVYLKIVQIENLPVAGINVFCKWKAPHIAAEPRSGETRPKAVVENSALWNESFVFDVRIGSLPSDALTLASLPLRIYVRRQRRMKAGFQTIGELEVDLSPLAGVGEVTKTSLLKNCVTNATVTFSVRLSQRGGDLVYHRAALQKTARDAGALASIFASRDLSAEAKKITAAAGGPPTSPMTPPRSGGSVRVSGSHSRDAHGPEPFAREVSDRARTSIGSVFEPLTRSSGSMSAATGSLDGFGLPHVGTSASKRSSVGTGVDVGELAGLEKDDGANNAETLNTPERKERQLQRTYDWVLQRRYREDMPLEVASSRVSDAAAVDELLQSMPAEFGALFGFGATADVQGLDLKELLESETHKLDWGALENGRADTMPQRRSAAVL